MLENMKFKNILYFRTPIYYSLFTSSYRARNPTALTKNPVNSAIPWLNRIPLGFSRSRKTPRRFHELRKSQRRVITLFFGVREHCAGLTKL